MDCHRKLLQERRKKGRKQRGRGLRKRGLYFSGKGGKVRERGAVSTAKRKGKRGQKWEQGSGQPNKKDLDN